MPSDPGLDPILAQIATPCVRLDAAWIVEGLNPAAAAFLGYSARRFVGQSVDALGLDAAARDALAAANPTARLRLERVRLAPTPERECFADLWCSRFVPPDARDGWLLELHPRGEFRSADPEAALPLALHAALKGLAHEIRNPLAGIRGAAQLLARRLEADADATRCLDVIRDETRRLDALLDRLLDPTPARPPERFNLHAVLERVRTLAEAEAGWAHVIQRDYDVSLPELDGDPDRLAQALWNLVRNALESGSSVVRLRTRAEAGVLIGETRFRRAARVEIEDNGRGVPDTLAERIFLPLVSGRADGSGLGLPLAQQIAREHRGALSYRSRPGHTVFTLLLPIGDPADGAGPTEAAA
jgi:two-component system nitrogen regulation sensor histidine kinase GlnL